VLEFQQQNAVEVVLRNLRYRSALELELLEPDTHAKEDNTLKPRYQRVTEKPDATYKCSLCRTTIKNRRRHTAWHQQQDRLKT